MWCARAHCGLAETVRIQTLLRSSFTASESDRVADVSTSSRRMWHEHFSLNVALTRSRCACCFCFFFFASHDLIFTNPNSGKMFVELIGSKGRGRFRFRPRIAPRLSIACGQRRCASANPAAGCAAASVRCAAPGCAIPGADRVLGGKVKFGVSSFHQLAWGQSEGAGRGDFPKSHGATRGNAQLQPAHRELSIKLSHDGVADNRFAFSRWAIWRRALTFEVEPDARPPRPQPRAARVSTHELLLAMAMASSSRGVCVMCDAACVLRLASVAKAGG